MKILACIALWVVTDIFVGAILILCGVPEISFGPKLLLNFQGAGMLLFCFWQDRGRWRYEAP